jgi:hypothetical protein
MLRIVWNHSVTVLMRASGNHCTELASPVETYPIAVASMLMFPLPGFRAAMD